MRSTFNILFYVNKSKGEGRNHEAECLGEGTMVWCL